MTRHAPMALFLAGLALPISAHAQNAVPPALPSIATQGQAASVAPAGVLDWTTDADGMEAAAILAGRLAQADLEGYAAGPGMAVAINQALAKAQSGSDADRAATDRLLTESFLDFMDFLQAPVPGILYGDDWARPPRQSRGVLLKNGKVVPSLKQFVTSNITVNPVYDGLRASALDAKPTGEERAKVVASLARLRGFPDRNRFVVVDSANQRLWMYENGHVVDHMKVVVGKREDNALHTPEISSVIYYATFNPYWHVPYHLVKAVANRYRAEGMRYLNGKGYEVIDRWDRDANVIDPKTVDWAAAQKTGDLKIRQRPGSDNSMGNMKFDFANPEGIYLHDTNHKEYFDLASRDKSNGCIRLEDAARFAKWLYKGTPVPATDVTEDHKTITEPVPVYVTYLTANANDGQLAFAKDIYGKDAATLASLEARSKMASVPAMSSSPTEAAN